MRTKRGTPGLCLRVGEQRRVRFLHHPRRGGSDVHRRKVPRQLRARSRGKLLGSHPGDHVGAARDQRKPALAVAGPPRQEVKRLAVDQRHERRVGEVRVVIGRKVH